MKTISTRVLLVCLCAPLWLLLLKQDAQAQVPSNPRLIFYDDFEDAPQFTNNRRSGWAHNELVGVAPCSEKPAFSTEVARKGRGSLKFHVSTNGANGNTCGTDWYKAVSSRITWNNPPLGSSWGGGAGNRADVVEWTSFSIFFPTWVDLRSSNEAGNWKWGIMSYKSLCCNAFMVLGILDGYLHLEIQPGWYGANKQDVRIAAMPKGQWVDIQIHHKFSNDPNVGMIDIYIGGVLRHSYRGRTAPAPGTGGEGYEPYIQPEIYGAFKNTPMTAYFDEIKFGFSSATLQDMLVDGNNTAPAPTPNQPPVANAGGDKTIKLPTNTVTLNGSGSDADGTISTYSWSKVSGPAGGAIQSPSTATTNLTGLIEGTYVYSLTVTDNDGNRSSDNVQVLVNPENSTNLPPTANAGGNKSVTLPTNTTSLSGSGTDADGTISSYSWTKVSGPAGGNIQSPSAAATSITGLNQGIYVYRLTVTDSDGATDNDDVEVNVYAAPAANQAPVSNAGGNKSVTLPTNTTRLNGAGTDADGTISTYRWAKVAGPAGGTIQSPTTASTSLTGLIAGIYVYRLTVTDNDGATDNDDVQVTVYAAPIPNQPPTSNAGGNLSVTLPNNSSRLGGTGTDSDGTIAEYTWRKISGPNGGNIESPASAETNILDLNAGVYVYRLTVTDNDGDRGHDEVQVTVNAAFVPNQLPLVNAGTNKVITLPTNIVRLTGTGNDPDGTITTYSWTRVSGPNAGNILSPAAGTTDVSGLVKGVYVFRLTCTDNRGGKAADDVQVTVNSAPPPPVNLTPTVNAGADQSVTLPTNLAKLSGSASDPDGTISTYQWTKISGPNGGSLLTPTQSASDISSLIQGSYTYRLTVTDNKGARSSDEVVITVNPEAPAPNKAPVANAGKNITLELPDNSTVLDGSGSSDPDGSIVSWTWVKVKGPGNDKLTNSDRAIANLSDLIEGSYEYQLTVTDNRGAKTSDRVTVTVIRINKNSVAVLRDTTYVTLPVQNTQLDASGSFDPDGTIASYQWDYVRGPSLPKLYDQNAAKTLVSDLIPGTYEFRLTLRDNEGAVTRASAWVIVRNNSSRRVIPEVNLYPNPAVSQTTLAFDTEIDGRTVVTVYDMQGRPVMTDNFIKNSRTFTRKLEVGKLPKGTYAVKVEVDQAEPVVKKLIRQ